jgi:uncharacterized repeat protein (TIGR03806 family)
MTWRDFDLRPRNRFKRLTILAALAGVWASTIHAFRENEKPALAPRPLWKTSRVVGSPEPPPPFTVEPAFTHIAWKNPIFAIREPGSEWLIVVEWPQAITASPSSDEQGGAGKPGPSMAAARARRVLDRPGEERTEPFLELEGRAIYCIEFHPRYRENGQVFVCSKTQPEGGPWVNILSRFVVSRGAEKDRDGMPVCDPTSEERILEWTSDGHDGGAVVFGHDGMLYVSVGDGSADSDDKLTAQDASSLLGKILRIDVDHPTPGMPYSIPPDNPFVDVDGARGEIWSLGHRNPWRMAVDAKTGGLWVGNNGQDLWEFAHLIKRGDNCGWSVYEGSHPFYLNRQQGPGRFAPPTVEHDHGAFRSLTGGVVYYGRRRPEINGAYVYGDYSTGAIWGVQHNGERVVWNRELAKTTLDIVGFATSPSEELLVLDYASGIYRLIESPPDDSHRQFPRKLSETGLFASLAELRPAAGVLPYVVTVPGWTDGAIAERLVALPGDTCIQRISASQWEFPEGAVLVQTLSIPQIGDDRRRRVETRLLTKQRGVWCGYSYVWNDTQDEAVLAPPSGMEVQLPPDITAHGDKQLAPRRWRVPSRTDCMSCHSRAANFVLGLNELQMNCTVSHDDVEMSQLRVFEQSNIFDQSGLPTLADRQRLVNPYDLAQDLEARARSYLHVNCSTCHVAAGGGNARIQLNLELKREDMQLLGAYPQHQSFGLTAALLVAPGEPERSVLYHRISRRGLGQMPPRGTHVIDREAVRLIHDWIAQMPPQRKFVKDWASDDVVNDLDQLHHGRLYETGSRLFTEIGCAQCHRFARGGGGAGPDLSGIGRKRSPRELLESLLEPSKEIAPEFAATIIVTTGGQILEGRVGQEDEQKLVLHTLDSLAEPVIVIKDQIDERYLSTTSTMPDRLLSTLQKSEILDLLAYVIADGDPQHPSYTVRSR